MMAEQTRSTKMTEPRQMPPEFAGLARPVYRIGVEQPWIWLTRGWRDFDRARDVSLTFGLIIAAVSAVFILGMWHREMLPYTLPLAAGFMFLAPLLGVAFYDISRRLEAGEPVRFWDVALSWRRHPGQIFTMGLLMMFLHLAWERLALLIYALFFGDQPASWEGFIQTLFFSTAGIPFLLTGTIIGGGLAVIAFAVGVVSFPMLLDRDCGTAGAVATSVFATIVNWRVLIGWAALIVLFTIAGIVTFCLGLAITMPLIGHASWHAYRDLVERQNDESAHPVSDAIKL